MDGGELLTLNTVVTLFSWLTGRTLAVVLWTGLGLLSIALLVLMRTQWGQARPLSKCIALSVFAHILLMGYAYGTRLFHDPPAEPQAESIPIRIVASETSDAEPPRRPDQQQPWERLAASELTVPATPSLDRRAAGAPSLVAPDVTDQANPEPGAMEAPAVHSLPAVEPERPDWTALQSKVTRVRNPQAATPLPDSPNPPPAPNQLTRPSPAPPDEAMARREAIPRRSLPPIALPPEASGDLLELGGRVQELAGLMPTAMAAEALASARDAVEQSDNRLALETRGAGSTHADSEQHSGSSGPAAQRGGEGRTHAADLAAGPRDVVARVLQAPPPRRLGDGAPLPELYRLRSSADRLALARQFGGDETTENAVDTALAWLAAHQSSDGRWDADSLEGGVETRVAGHDRRGAGTDADTGISGLALLAFLAAGHTHLEGQYHAVVGGGLQFLIQSQKADGSLAGNARLFAAMYCHGMASLALSEAYAMTGDPQLRQAVQRAVEYTTHAQHASTGGWRYQPGDKGDMSQFGWQVMALKSAELAGLPMAPETRAASLKFLQSTSSGTHGGLAAYRAGERPSPTMTAEALTCRCFLDVARSAEADDEAARYVLGQLPEQGRLNLYHCYYGTLGLFQLQGDAWETWHASLRRTLLARQHKTGAQAGSWDPNTVWGQYGGRVYTTALAALCLEVYYRYLPLYVRLHDDLP